MSAHGEAEAFVDSKDVEVYKDESFAHHMWTGYQRSSHCLSTCPLSVGLPLTSLSDTLLNLDAFRSSDAATVTVPAASCPRTRRCPVRAMRASSSLAAR